MSRMIELAEAGPNHFCDDCVNHICTMLGRCEKRHREAVSALARDKIAALRAQGEKQ